MNQEACVPMTSPAHMGKLVLYGLRKGPSFSH